MTIFLSTLSLRRATWAKALFRYLGIDFYPRSPCGERPGPRPFSGTWALISIHALLAESDPRAWPASSPRPYFYPRSPCGERPHIRSTLPGRPCISIHALLAESDTGLGVGLYLVTISIHALLAESDIALFDFPIVPAISIHALLAESDGSHHRSSGPLERFLSTLSLRRATMTSSHPQRADSHFYPRSPCGERQNARPDIRQPYVISIHALLAESDCVFTLPLVLISLFLSTLSLRRATDCGQYYIRAREISIHALLAESDPYTMTTTICIVSFLSTLSLRRATSSKSSAKSTPEISIHALLAESDNIIDSNCYFFHDFYPRSPCGERR